MSTWFCPKCKRRPTITLDMYPPLCGDCRTRCVEQVGTEPDLDGLTENELRLYPTGTINNDGGAAAVARHFAISLAAERRKVRELEARIEELKEEAGPICSRCQSSKAACVASDYGCCAKCEHG